mgnify:CR=1 FL=1
MTHLKQILTYFFTVFALLTATLPAAYADNKKTAKKETVKKDAAKKDNAKKEPADKKKDDKKKDGAKSENSKKDNAKGGKKQEKEKNNAKKETPKEAAKNSKEKKDNKDSKNKKETGKDKKENKQAAQAGGRNQESQKKDGKQKDKKADTAKQEALKKQEAAKKEAERREAARREAARQEAAHRETPSAPRQSYDEDGMQALVKQQSEKERRQEAKAPPAPSPKVEFSEPASSQSSSKRTAALSRREADELIGNAMGLLGVSYRFGGSSVSSGFDCSGFMQHIFRKTMQINLPRTSAEQAKMGVAVSRSELQPGDMVFFSTSRGRISHVGLYIGNNRFIHAPRTGKSIEITSLGNKYWNSKYVTARRVKRYDSGRFTR